MHGINLGNGSNESKLTILYNELRNKIKNIEERNKQKNKEGNNIGTTLGTHLLLILDNVNRPDLVSQDRLDKLPDFFHVIITTRESASDFSHIKMASVDCLDEDESVELLSNLRSFGKNQKEPVAARKIAKLLGGFTLAIELTGSYLKKTPSVTYRKQYKLLKSNLKGTMETMVDITKHLRRHQAQYISVVLKSSLSALAYNARKALNIAALMSPDAVALGWLKELVDKYPREDYYQISAAFDWFMKLIGLKKKHELDIIDELTGYNLLTPLEGQSNIARIHRLVAKSLPISDKKRKEITEIIREKCNVLLEENGQFWSDSKNYWNITPVSEYLKQAGEELEASKDPEQEIDWDLTWMMSTAGNILKSLEKINEAYEEYLLCFKICINRHHSFPGNTDVEQDFRISRDYLNELLTILTLRSEKEKAAGNADIAQDLAEKDQKLESIIRDTESSLDSRHNQIQEMWAKAFNNFRGGKKNYDYYISYAHEDNQSVDGQPGFVDEFVEKLRNSKEHQEMFGGEVTIFFDKTEIHDRSDWANAVFYSLAHSRFLIVLMSPNYFKSVQCAWEFDWWKKHEMLRYSPGEDTAPMLIVTVEDLFNSDVNPHPAIPLDLQARFPNWITQIRQIQFSPNFDLSNLECNKIDTALNALCHAVKGEVFKQDIARNSPTNPMYPKFNINFVGRRKNLRSVRQTLCTTLSSTICALTGLGGIGKTEIAIQYGNTFAWDYGLGRVFINCENATSLNKIILSSGIAEMNGWMRPNGSEKQQLAFLFSCLKMKRDGIIQRNEQEGNPDTLGAHILLILDNVDNLELISTENLDILPDYFHIIITTRANLNEFTYIHSEPVDRLSEAESVELLNDLRPFGSDESEIEAAHQIAQSLDGFTLVVELIGAYLARNPYVTYQQQYERMVVSHPETFQVMADRTRRLTRHSADTVATVLESTLSSLSSNARKALYFAAQMSPDAVALSWLPELLGLDEDEGWEALDELTGYSLLTPLGGEPNIARIHRLVAEKVKQGISEEAQKEIIAKIRTKCYDLLHKDISFWYASENSWNITPVSGFLELTANRWSVETSEEEIDWVLTWMLGAAGNILKKLNKICEASEMYKLRCGICKQRVTSFPNNNDVIQEDVQSQLDLGASFNNLGDMEKSAGNTVAAVKWYEKALEIYQELADKMPMHTEIQKNLEKTRNQLTAIKTKGWFSSRLKRGEKHNN